MPVSRTDVGQACGTYVDFAGNIGIGGTPAIDVPSQTIYFVARTKENGTFVQRLHALDIRDGSERPGSPVVIQASVTGTGDGRDAQNNIAFNARTDNQRSGLLIDHGTVYIAWASYCDQGPYHGWILGLRRGEPSAGDGPQHVARRRPRRHLAVRRRAGGGCEPATSTR